MPEGLSNLLIFLKNPKDSQAEKIKGMFLQNKSPEEVKAIEDKFNQVLKDWDLQSSSTYDAALSLCQLAYLYEQNGDAVDHAKRLASVFTNKKALIDYLVGFSKTASGRELPIHNACLFDFSEAELDEEQKQYWRNLASKNNNMLDAEFRQLLPYAKKLMDSLKRETVQPAGKIDYAKLKEMQGALDKKAKEYKLCHAGRDGTPNDKRQNKLKEISKDIAQHRIELAKEIHGRIQIQNMNVSYWIALLEQLKSAETSHQILIKHGIAPKDIERFVQLTAKSNDKLMPDILINGADIGYSGYYLRKLNMNNADDKAIAACLGKMTACCQYIGGLGDACVLHGITQESSDFYVLCEGDFSSPKADDKLIGMSWAWRSTSGALVFDSIEVAPNLKDNSIVIDLFRYAAHQLCHDPSYKEYGIVKCNTGANSGITNKVGLKDYPTSYEVLEYYDDYSDAYSQWVLADSQTPYLFFKNEKSALDIAFNKQLEQFINNLVELKEADFKKDEQLKKYIAFALSFGKKFLLDHFKNKLINQPMLQETLNELIASAKKFKKILDRYNKNKILTKESILKCISEGAYVNSRNNLGQTALHLAADKIDLELTNELIQLGIDLGIRDQYGNTALVWLLDQVLYKKEKKVESNADNARQLALRLIEAGTPLNAKDKDENSALSFAASNGDLEMVQWLVEHGANIEIDDHDARTPLYLAVEKKHEAVARYLLIKGAKSNVDSYTNKIPLPWHALKQFDCNVVLELFPNIQDAIKSKNKQGESILHWYASIPETLKTILTLYPEKDRLAAVQEKDNYGTTVLHRDAYNTERLQAILTLLPEQDRLAAVQEKDNYGTTVLHRASSNPELLKIILALYPEEARLAAVQEKNMDGKTVLSCAAVNPESLKIILALYPEEARLAAVQEKDKNGNTVLSWAAVNPESLKIILALYPEEARLAAVQEKDKNGRTVLSWATVNPESLKIILALYPEEARLAAVQQKDKNGRTVLSWAAVNPESLKIILALYPEEARLAAVQQKDKNGRTVLSWAAVNPESLKIILALYPEEARLAAVQEKDKNCDTVLHRAAYNTEGLKAILTLLPEEARLAAVQEKDKNSDTVLHWAVYSTESLQSILTLLPEEARLTAVLEKDKNSDTVLHLAAYSTTSWQAILTLLPEQDRLAAVQEKDKNGNTVLHLAAYSTTSWQAILTLLPEQDRFAAVQEKDKNGNTVLHLAADNPESLQAILTLLPEQDRLAALLEKDEDGSTVLHLAADNPESLQSILTLLPEQDRLAAAQEKDEDGSTVLHLAAGNPKSLQAILTLLPEQDRLAAVQEKDKDGETVLHMAFDKPESLQAIFMQLPRNARYQALKIISNQLKNERIIGLFYDSVVPAEIEMTNRPFLEKIDTCFKQLILSNQLNSITTDEVIALMQLRERLADSSSEETAGDILRSWKNEHRLANPNLNKTVNLPIVTDLFKSFGLFAGLTGKNKTESLADPTTMKKQRVNEVRENKKRKK